VSEGRIWCVVRATIGGSRYSKKRRTSGDLVAGRGERLTEQEVRLAVDVLQELASTGAARLSNHRR